MTKTLDYTKDAYTLKELDLQGEQTILDEFNVSIAWKLGTIVREIALQEFAGSSVVIDIKTLSGLGVFRAVTSSGSTADNESWVNRKFRTTQRFEKPSFYIGQKLRDSGRKLEGASFIDEKEYATHGGAVPIRVKSFDGIVGVLIVSGLKQYQDHALAINGLLKLKGIA